jgi:hypothetical protein
MCMCASVLQVGLLQEDKVDPEEVARQHTTDWLNRSAQHPGVSSSSCNASQVVKPASKPSTGSTGCCLRCLRSTQGVSLHHAMCHK